MVIAGLASLVGLKVTCYWSVRYCKAGSVMFFLQWLCKTFPAAHGPPVIPHWLLFFGSYYSLLSVYVPDTTSYWTKVPIGTLMPLWSLSITGLGEPSWLIQRPGQECRMCVLVQNAIILPMHASITLQQVSFPLKLILISRINAAAILFNDQTPKMVWCKCPLALTMMPN